MKKAISTIILILTISVLWNSTDVLTVKDYRLVKTADDAKVFLVKENRRVHIPNEQVFEAGGYKWGDIETVTKLQMNKINNTALIKSPVDAKVYLVADGKKQWIPDETTFLGAGLKWDDIVLIAQPQVEFYLEENFIQADAVEIVKNIAEKQTNSVIQTDNNIEGVKTKAEKSNTAVINEYKRPDKIGIIEVGNLRPEEPRTILVGINNNGEAVGYSMKTGSDSAHPILFKDGKIIDIGNGRTGDAKAINDNGQVVGQMSMSFNEGNGGGVDHAFLWQNGKIKDLGGLSNKSYLSSIATDINNKGQIVGYSWIENGDGQSVHAFLWEDNNMIDIGTLGGNELDQYTQARAINESKQIVGCSLAKDNKEHPFVWENNVMKDLGDKYGKGGCAVDINDQGEVLGYYYTKEGRMGLSHNSNFNDFLKIFLLSLAPQISEIRVLGQPRIESFIWFDGEFEFFSDSRNGFWPSAINNNSEVTGSGQGIMYYKNGDFVVYQGVSGWFISGFESGSEINDHGQIVGAATMTGKRGNYGVILSLPKTVNNPPTFNFTADGDNTVFDEDDKQKEDYDQMLAENPLKYKITWISDDPDDDAKISLYYYYFSKNFVQNFEGDGNLLISNLSEDSKDDGYVWDMSDLKPGNYYLYAVIDDGKISKKVESERLKIIKKIIQDNLKIESEEEVVEEVIIKKDN